MNERRPLVPVGPAIDPWGDHPIHPVEIWRQRSFIMLNRVEELIMVPVVPGPARGRTYIVRRLMEPKCVG